MPTPDDPHTDERRVDAPGAPGNGQAGADPHADEEPPRRTPWWRYVLYGLGGLVGLVLALLLVVVLLLQTSWGSRYAIERILPLVNPYEDVALTVGEVDGNWLTGLRLYDLDLAQGTESPDSLSRAHIDTLRLRYNLLPLLNRRLDVGEVTLAGVWVNARQGEDGQFDLLAPFAPDTVAVDTSGTGFAIEVDELVVRDLDARLLFYPPEADSVLRVDGLYAQVDDLIVDDGYALTLDTLYGAFRPPGGGFAARLRAGGAVRGGVVTVTGLAFDSPQSDLFAQGQLRLPDDDTEAIEDVDFEVRAAPLAFDDLRALVPALPTPGTVTLDLDVGGTSQRLVLDGEAAFSAGGRVTLRGALTPSAEDVNVALEGAARGLDLGAVAGLSAPARLNATFEADLQGEQLAMLDGTVEAVVTDTRYGTYQVERVAADVRFENGLARVDAEGQLQGGAFDVDGTVQPFADVPTYDLRARVRGADVGALTGNPAQSSDLSATLTAQGRGLSPADATAQVELDVAPSRINNYRIESADATLRLDDGDVRFSLRGLFPDGEVFADGTAALTADPITYEVTAGRFRNVDLAALTGSDTTGSSLSGTFSLSGRGTAPDAIDLDGDVTITDSYYGTYDLPLVDLDAAVRDGRLTADAVADLGEAGRLDLTAVGRPFDETPSIRLTRGEFRSLDVGALLDNPNLSSDLSGTVDLDVTGFDPQTGRFAIDLSLDASTLNRQAIEALDVDASLRSGRLVFAAAAELPEGFLRLEGAADPFAAVPTYEVDTGAFRGLDLGALANLDGWETRLNGTLTLDGRGLDPEALALDARLDLDDSRVNAQPISDGTVLLDIADGRVGFDAALAMPDGAQRVAGTARPFDERPAYRLTEGRLENLHVGALLGRDDLETSLTGAITLEGEGFDPETMALQTRFELTDSRVNDAAIEGADVQATLADGALEAGLVLASGEGQAQATVSGRFFQDQPVYEAEGTVTQLDVGAFLPTDTLDAALSLAFDVEGEGLDPETMRLRGLVTSAGAAYQDVAADTLVADFWLADGVLSLDTLVVRTNFADATGGGRVALFDSTAASDFRFTADVENLEPVRPLIGAERFALREGELQARIYGDQREVLFDVTGEADNFVFNAISLARFDGSVAGRLGPERDLQVGEVQATVGFLSLPQFAIRETLLEAQYDGDEVRFLAEADVDERRDVRFGGLVDLRPDQQRLVLEDFGFRFDDDEWELLQEATVSYGDEYRVQGFLLYSGDQQIAIDGVVDPNGTQNLVVTIEQFGIDAITDLIDYEGLGGTLTGTLDLTGPAAAPNIDGTLVLDVESQGEGVGDLRTEIRYDSLRLNLDARLTSADGSTLVAEGYVPLDFSLAPDTAAAVGAGVQAAAAQAEGGVNLTIAADSFGIGWIEPFLPPESVDEIEGRLEGTVEVTGTFEAPQLAGALVLEQGRISLPQLGLDYEELEVDAEFEEGQILLQHAEMASGDGSLIATGSINLESLGLGAFDLDASMDEFLAIGNDEYRAVLNGDVQLTGTTQQPRLEGGVQVVSADIYLTGAGAGGDVQVVELDEEDLLLLEQVFGYRVTESDTTTFDFYLALAMDLDVELERDTWVRQRVNPEMAIQFDGDLDVQKDPGAELPEVFGDIEVVPARSYVNQFGRRFNITEGRIVFNGDPLGFRMDVGAEYEVESRRAVGEPEVVILLNIEGRIDDLDITFDSDPQMDEVDVISYIATGRPAGQALQLGGGGGGVLAGAGGLAANQVAGIVEGIASRELGLDVVEIRQDGLRGTVLVAGKYWTRRLYAGIELPISFGGAAENDGQIGNATAPDFTAEYELYEWLLLRGRFIDTAQLELNLLWEYAY